MFAVVTYDKNEKRVQRVEKTLAKYLVHVQNSVFEGNINKITLSELEQDVLKVISPREDSVRIYLFEREENVKVRSLGAQESTSDII